MESTIPNVIVFTKTKTKTRYIYKRPLLNIDHLSVSVNHIKLKVHKIEHNHESKCWTGKFGEYLYNIS